MGLSAILNEGNVFFRAPLLLCLVWFLWGVNTLVFERLNIDYCAALDFDRSSTLAPRTIMSSAVAMFCLVTLLWFLDAVEWPFVETLVIPSALYVVGALLLVAPLNVLHRRGREKLLRNLYRVFSPNPAGILFVEVVLGDMLTSLSKTLADLQVSLCVLVSHALAFEDSNKSSLAAPAAGAHSSLQEACAQSWLRPLVTSLPFLLRFRQCVVAYRATGQAFPHLCNAAKYASALPVILISTFAHNFPASYGLAMHKMWLVAITFNSFFSFLWDIVMDFGLFRSDTTYLFLRQRLYYMNAPSGGANSYHQYRKISSTDISAAGGDAAPAGAPGPLKPKSSSKALLDEEEEEDEQQQQAAQQSSMAGVGAGMPAAAAAAAAGDDAGDEGAGLGPEEHRPLAGGALALVLEPGLGKVDAVAEAAKRVLSIGSASAPEGAGGGLSKRASASTKMAFAQAQAHAHAHAHAPDSERRAEGSPLSARSTQLQLPHYPAQLPHTPVIYYAAILLDFLLRVLWSFKLSVHLHLTQEGLTFVLEICEVLRRFLWLFFRIEWQVIEMEEDAPPRLSSAGSSSAGVVADIELGPVWEQARPQRLRARTLSDRPGASATA
jgi:hypothetical protein